MKEGKTITELAQAIQDQNESKVDYIADTTKVEVSLNEESSRGLNQFHLRLPVTKEVATTTRGKSKQVVDMVDLGMNRYAMGQIAGHTKVPMALVDLLRDGTPREQEELANLLTVRLQENPALRMVRTMQDMQTESQFARAFLSDRYRRLDNYDLADAVLPVLAELKGLQVDSTEVTDERMYIKVSWPKLTYEVKKGDVVQAGVVVSNSEVGSGALRVEPYIMRLACVNGMIAADSGVRKHHVGRQSGGYDVGDAYELYTQETLNLDDAAFFGKVTDTVRAIFQDEGKFRGIVDRMIQSAGEALEPKADVQAAVTVMAQKLKLNEGEKGSVLKHLIEGGDLTRWGFLNAVTRASADVESYDRATELEKAGGQVLAMPPAEWKLIASARLAKAAA